MNGSFYVYTLSSLVSNGYTSATKAKNKDKRFINHFSTTFYHIYQYNIIIKYWNFLRNVSSFDDYCCNLCVIIMYIQEEILFCCILLLVLLKVLLYCVRCCPINLKLFGLFFFTNKISRDSLKLNITIENIGFFKNSTNCLFICNNVDTRKHNKTNKQFSINIK